MGYSQASGYQSAVDEGLCSLEVAIQMHLTSNCYPPLPVSLVPACVKAIHNVEDGEPDKPVRLPVGMKLGHKPHGVLNKNTNRPPSWRLVEAAHLDAFVQYEEE